MVVWRIMALPNPPTAAQRPRDAGRGSERRMRRASAINRSRARECDEYCSSATGWDPDRSVLQPLSPAAMPEQPRPWRRHCRLQSRSCLRPEAGDQGSGWSHGRRAVTSAESLVVRLWSAGASADCAVPERPLSRTHVWKSWTLRCGSVVLRNGNAKLSDCGVAPGSVVTFERVGRRPAKRGRAAVRGASASGKRRRGGGRSTGMVTVGGTGGSSSHGGGPGGWSRRGR